VIDRRTLIGMVALSLLARPLPSDAQEAVKMRRVGVLFPPPADHNVIALIRRIFVGMREPGWIEGRNIVYEQRSADGHVERLPSLAAELVASRIDVLVTATSPATRAAKDATGTIPIVFVEVSGPVRQGLVASLSRPGGNLTGFADVSLELMPKRLELLRELMPHATRIAVLVDPAFQIGLTALDDSKRAARTLGIQLQTFEVGPSTDLEATFARVRQWRAEALTFIPAVFPSSSERASPNSRSEIVYLLLQNCHSKRRQELCSSTRATCARCMAG
jgi:ABC-type uncharacterized transport system substrate-binding protein